MKRGFWLWIILVLALIIGTFYLASGKLGIYLDWASLAFSIVLAILVSFTSNTPAEIIGYIRQSRQDTDFDAVIARQGVVYFQLLQKLVITLGILGTFIGSVAVLRNIKEASESWYGMSVAVITVLYSLIFSLIFTQPFIGALKKKIAQNQSR